MGDVEPIWRKARALAASGRRPPSTTLRARRWRGHLVDNDGWGKGGEVGRWRTSACPGLPFQPCEILMRLGD